MGATSTRPRVENRERSPLEFDELALKAWVGEILNRHPAVGMAVGVVRNQRLEFFYTHGVADIVSNMPITEDTVFRIASISKTFTAIALMQLWEQGLVELDAPANDYLRAFQLVSAKAGHRPATLRHLLTHTSGIPEMVHPSRALMYAFGESVKLGRPLPTLGEYYRGGLHLVAEPGTRFMYTDHNFATVGQIVEDVSGQPLDRYLRQHVFEPLGMGDTDLIRSERVESRLATGYNLRSQGAKAVTDRQWITAAASSIYSTPRDMARYVAALLGGGANQYGSVLKRATLELMFEPHYQPHPLIPGIGLAFDRFDVGGHLAIGHEGVLPGFNSQIFAMPDYGVGVMAFTNGAPRAMFWLPAEAIALLKRLVGLSNDVIRRDVPQHPEIWGDLCGWYQLPAGPTDTRLRATVGLGAEVFVRRRQLTLRLLNPIPTLYRGFALHPDDDNNPYVFRIDASTFDIGTARVIFSREPERGTMRVHLDVMPLSLEKQPANTNPRLRIMGGLGALGLAMTALAVRRRRTRASRLRTR
ncbi:MAG TPA: serine hydrolase domain-containing protein [Candidatus Dormibacteraeota bacterium]